MRTLVLTAAAVSMLFLAASCGSRPAAPLEAVKIATVTGLDIPESLAINRAGGCLYVSTLSITGHDAHCTLTMRFDGKAQSLLARIMMIPMGLLFKGSTRKMLLRDLNDIKAVVEQEQVDENPSES